MESFDKEKVLSTRHNSLSSPLKKNTGHLFLLFSPLLLDFSPQGLTTPLCLGFSLTHHLPFLSISCPMLCGPFLLPVGRITSFIVTLLLIHWQNVFFHIFIRTLPLKKYLLYMYFNPKGNQKKVNWNKKLIFNLQGH